VAGRENFHDVEDFDLHDASLVRVVA
jgi:hypothetical protein